MKRELAKSENDTVDNPTELKLIGWAPDAEPEHPDVPGMPRHLEILHEGRGTLELDWKPPATGGEIRNYVILRRDKPEQGQPFTPWQQCQASLDTETFLTNQPRGIELEYRVIAINNTGNSVPSNTVAAVL